MSLQTDQEVCLPTVVRLRTSVLEAGSINEEIEAYEDEAAMEEAVSTCQDLTGPLCPRVPKDGIRPRSPLRGGHLEFKQSCWCV